RLGSPPRPRECACQARAPVKQTSRLAHRLDRCSQLTDGDCPSNEQTRPEPPKRLLFKGVLQKKHDVALWPRLLVNQGLTREGPGGAPTAVHPRARGDRAIGRLRVKRIAPRLRQPWVPAFAG